MTYSTIRFGSISYHDCAYDCQTGQFEGFPQLLFGGPPNKAYGHVRMFRNHPKP